jgi:hypothetical protein
MDGKRKPRAPRMSRSAKAQPPAPQDISGDALDAAPASFDGEGVQSSDISLHDLFTQQAREMIERADLDEEQKQSILIAMSCPCCGAGGMSYTVKLKRRP